MIACLDAYYPLDAQGRGVVACVTANSWSDQDPLLCFTASFSGAHSYQPGQLFRRELPGLILALQRLPKLPEVVVVDAFVWLGNFDRPGLGGRLYEALGRRCTVIGVAKTWHREAAPCKAITRGDSCKPLFISAAGVELDEAAENVRSMHGNFRIPTLLKMADRLSRRPSSDGAAEKLY